jgi:hypothetical protein
MFLEEGNYFILVLLPIGHDHFRQRHFNKVLPIMPSKKKDQIDSTGNFNLSSLLNGDCEAFPSYSMARPARIIGFRWDNPAIERWAKAHPCIL